MERDNKMRGVQCNDAAQHKHAHCRYGLLAGCALCQGAILAPLVSAVLATHPGVLVAALVGTSAVFACFSLAALMSQRRR